MICASFPGCYCRVAYFTEPMEYLNLRVEGGRALANVRFAPDRDRIADFAEGPRWAQVV